MCGISGHLGSTLVDTNRLSDTMNLMRRRGPDGGGVANLKIQTQSLSLLHTRLAVIDPHSRSDQPWSDDDVTLIYNGEIYNFLEVREELKTHGHTFRTNSDTEVLFQAYKQWGLDGLSRLEGMWAFALFDKRSQKLILSRDRFGEKPLYFSKTPDGFTFGSEIKFLESLLGKKFEINPHQISRYLVNGYKSLYKHDSCFYVGVEEVPPSTHLLIDVGRSPWENHFQKMQYWKLESGRTNMSLSDAIEGVQERVTESLRIRLRSDVKIAFCLSGGIDSGGLVCTAAKKFNVSPLTFSLIDSDERYNESENIDIIVKELGCKNIKIPVHQPGSISHLQELISYHDGPLATLSYLIHSYISKSVKDHGCKVVFTGVGADEMLAGYYDHYSLHLFEMKDHPSYQNLLNDWKTHIAPIVRNPYLQDPEVYLKNPNCRDHIYLNNEEFSECLTYPFSENFREEYFCSSFLHNRMMNELFHEGTRVILHEDDLNSMYNSVENRAPFLDRHLVEFCYQIPIEHLIQDGYGKFVLREAFKEILPEKVRQDRRKRGFNAAISSIFDFSDPEVKHAFLGESPVFKLVRREKIEGLLALKNIPNSYSKFLFNFLNVKMFLEMRQYNA